MTKQTAFPVALVALLASGCPKADDRGAPTASPTAVSASSPASCARLELFAGLPPTRNPLAPALCEVGHGRAGRSTYFEPSWGWNANAQGAPRPRWEVELPAAGGRFVNVVTEFRTDNRAAGDPLLGAGAAAPHEPVQHWALTRRCEDFIGAWPVSEREECRAPVRSCDSSGQQYMIVGAHLDRRCLSEWMLNTIRLVGASGLSWRWPEDMFDLSAPGLIDERDAYTVLTVYVPPMANGSGR